jgi:signal peptidase I
LNELTPGSAIPSEPTPRPSRHGIRQFLRETLETVGLAVILFLGINLVSARVRVEGYSMIPTLRNGEYVLVSRIAYKLGDFKRGDIIVFRPPMYPEASSWQRLLGLPDFSGDYEDYIKRIIGLPGETVKVADGRVFINGVPLEEPYIAAPPDYYDERTVPAGELYVLGDNRGNSADSHAWGFVPQQNVLGKAVVIYWPFANFMIIPSDQSVLAAP